MHAALPHAGIGKRNDFAGKMAGKRLIRLFGRRVHPIGRIFANLDSGRRNIIANEQYRAVLGTGIRNDILRFRIYPALSQAMKRLAVSAKQFHRVSGNVRGWHFSQPLRR